MSESEWVAEWLRMEEYKSVLFYYWYDNIHSYSIFNIHQYYPVLQFQILTYPASGNLVKKWFSSSNGERACVPDTQRGIRNRTIETPRRGTLPV